MPDAVTRLDGRPRAEARADASEHVERGWPSSPALPLVARVRRAIPWWGFAIGCALLVVSYVVAEREVSGGRRHFALYWIGVVAFVLPAAIRLTSDVITSTERLLLIAALGLYSTIPKYLSYRGALAYFDEVGHWTQTERLIEDGLLFVKNSQITVISDYPGLHSMAAAIHHFTGLSTTTIAAVVIAVLHAAALLGVAEIARSAGASERSCGIAALWYSIGPGFWFFSSQFAYESFALVLLVWALAAFLRGLDEPSSLGRRWGRLGLLLASVVIVTHHLTSYMTLIVLTCVAVGAAALRWFGRVDSRVIRQIACWWLFVAALTGFWFATQARNTRGYVSPYVSNGATDLMRLLTGQGRQSSSDESEGARKLFAGSTLPNYELALGYLTPLILLVVTGWALVALRRRLLGNVTIAAMSIFSMAYFAVFPLMFSESGAEIARRTWSFTSLGIAILIAIAFDRRWDSTGRRSPVARSVWSVTAIAVLIGNTATGMNEVYRFPGQYIYGSDTRSATEEVKDAARWFIDQYGENQSVVGDRTIQLWFGSIARSRWSLPTSSNRLWDFVLAEQPIDPALLSEAVSEGLRWVVIDRRQADNLPLIGFYVDQTEPLARLRTQPLGIGSVTKFDDAPWAIRVYSSTNIDVYRIDVRVASEIARDRDGFVYGAGP